MWAAWAAWEACCGESLTPCGDSLPYSSTTTLHCLHRRCRHHRRLRSIHLDTLTLHAAPRSELRLSPPLLAAAPVGGGSNSLSPWACSRNPPALARPGAAAPAHRCGYGSWCVVCAWPTWCAWCGRICATSVHVHAHACHAMLCTCHAMHAAAVCRLCRLTSQHYVQPADSTHTAASLRCRLSCTCRRRCSSSCQ